MYKTILVNESIENGEKLIKKLEERKFPIVAAFWRHLDEEGLWRLVIVSPFVGREGPLRTYGYVREAVDGLGRSVHFGLGDISVMSPSWSQFRDLRRTLEGKEGSRLGVRGAGRWLDEDFYLYRWNPDLNR